MKNISSYLLNNLWLIILALVFAYLVNSVGHCYPDSTFEQCHIGQLDYFTFNFIGFLFASIGFYILLLIGSYIGKHNVKDKIIKEINEDNPLGNNALSIGEKHKLKIPFEHYEAIRKFFVEKIENE